MVYATNSSFKLVEHKEFKAMIELLRPCYKPPNRISIGDELLGKTYNKLSLNVFNSLPGKSVCMALDGWSNVHNDPIICISVYNIEDGNVHLIETVDTEDKSHTGEYLCELAVQAIIKCENYNCKVTSFVTDNAYNMRKMREDLAIHPDMNVKDILTYGCSSHILHLLVKDLQIPGIAEHVKTVIKYFRNTHFANAKYKMAGGKSLKLPFEVRWNTLSDMLESFIENWHILAKVCNENRAAFDPNIIKKINDLNLKNQVEDYNKILKLISVTLDKSQSDKCTISQVTEVWLDLIEQFKDEFPAIKKKVDDRMSMAMTPAHYLANI